MRKGGIELTLDIFDDLDVNVPAIPARTQVFAAFTKGRCGHRIRLHAKEVPSTDEAVNGMQ
jgi:hypothetical protein